jgi:hypothetical protein
MEEKATCRLHTMTPKRFFWENLTNDVDLVGEHEQLLYAIGVFMCLSFKRLNSLLLELTNSCNPFRSWQF